MKVKLEDIVDCLDFSSFTKDYYYNPKTNKIYTSEEKEIMNYNEDEWDDLIEDSYRLPEVYEINEYKIIKDFIDTLENNKVKEELLRKIQGKGAFRRFKDTCIEYNIINDWYKYRETALRKIAIKWCKQYNIEYEV